MTRSERRLARRKAREEGRPLISGIIWLGLGLLLLGVSTGVLPELEYSWPAILIIIGMAILVSNLKRKHPPTTPQTPTL